MRRKSPRSARNHNRNTRRLSAAGTFSRTLTLMPDSSRDPLYAAAYASARYSTAAARLQNRDALNAELGTFLAARTSAEWVELLNKAGVPCGPIHSIDQVFADPQVRHLGIVREIATATGVLRVVGQPVSLGRTPSRNLSAPPGRGEHTDEVLRELGFSEAEIGRLRQDDVI